MLYFKKKLLWWLNLFFLLCVLENKNRKRKQDSNIFQIIHKILAQKNDEGKFFFSFFVFCFLYRIYYEKINTKLLIFHHLHIKAKKRKFIPNIMFFFYVFLHETCYFSSSDSLIRKFRGFNFHQKSKLFL